MGKKEQRGRELASGRTRIFELEVTIIRAMVTEEFAKANPRLSRTIQIRGNQTLAKLHEAIFDAFDRFDEHLYEFQFGGKTTNDRNARRYALPMDTGMFGEDKPAGVVTKTTLDALGLKEGDVFAYWFDFGDDWWHRIAVAAIHDGPGTGKYPRVTARIGASPPQYPGMDDEEGEDDGEAADEE